MYPMYVISIRTDCQSPRACEKPDFNLSWARMSYKWIKVSFRSFNLSFSHPTYHHVDFIIRGRLLDGGPPCHLVWFRVDRVPLFSLPSDASDVQTDTTPPTSPTLSGGEGKMRTPKDILDAFRRLGQVSTSAKGNSDATPTRPPKQLRHHTNSQLIANDEAGYEADGDGNGEGDADSDGDKGARPRPGASAGTTTMTRPIRRPTFLRIDTRQHRRVASMLAIRPGYTFGNMDVARPPRTTGKLGALPSIRLLKPTTTTTSVAGSDGGGVAVGECYELRRRPRAEPVGLGIGFPENHPLRNRAFSMPVPHSVSPIFDPDEPEVEEEKNDKARGVTVQGQEWEWEARRSEWFPSRLPSTGRSMQMHKEKTKATQGGVYEPSPVRIAKLRPTFLEVSPSPIECLPACRDGDVRTLRCDDVHDRSEIMMERERYCALARKEWLKVDLS
ncbi:hypothetical protein JVT61DRAFT_8064 [Boletus reticuloceps]|uniref:Uncharacterized protein n=1 Tax=Boletus reticuloceps TaxID=495285 RepID=A0A8I3A6K0_9AGAM|nr:hypothetical protein JVT61DRAFT_8064 [Boletus reticuloceps]